RLTIQGSPAEYWTSESSIQLGYTLKASDGFDSALPGFPRIQFYADSPLKLVNVPAEMPSANVDIGAKKPLSVPLNYPLLLDGAPVRPSDVKVDGRFRGQKIAAATTVTFMRTPDTIYHEYPPPQPTAEFTMPVDEGAYQGSLVIVLDCS